MELKPITTIHTRKEFSSTDDFSTTPQSLVLAYYNKELGNRSYLTQEANIDELKVLVCAFLNRLGGRIYIGIDPDSGKVKGVPVDDVDTIITDVYNACSKISPNPMIITPKIDVSYLPILEDGSFSGKYVLKVFVEQGEKSTIYSASHNDYYYRTEAGANGKYTFAEYAQETERRLKGEFVHELVLFHDEVDRRAEDELNSRQSFNLNVPIYTFESSTLEYKRFRGIGDLPQDTNSNSATNKRTLTRTICSFLNTYGGRIYLGISDHRKIIGVDEKNAEEMKKQILTCLEEISPSVKEGLVQVDIIDIEDSKKKILKIKVQPGELDKIYSLTTVQFGAYWRNGPSCQLYRASHYRTELAYRIRKTFQRKKVVFSDDEVQEEREKNKLSECIRVLHHSLNSLQRDYLYKWESLYHLEGFTFPQEVKGVVEITLGLQHFQSGDKEIDLALELLESGLESVLDFKRYQSLISVIALYLLKNQHKRLSKDQLEKAKRHYSKALLHIQKRENSSQSPCQLHNDDADNHVYKEIFTEIASPQHVESEASACLNLEILHALTDLKQRSQVRHKPLKIIEGVVQDIVPGPRSSKLSIEDMRNEVMLSVVKFPVTIVHGGTGSGKTTQLPQYLRQLFPTGRIALCQPYKESLDPIIDRIREQAPDKKVFQITHKQHDKDSVNALAQEDGIFVMTHTTMLFQMLYDPNFEQYRCIIIDEPHERLVDTDVLIAFMILMLKEAKPSTPKFILSSATLDADHIIRVLGEVGKNMCNVLEINSARSYNVINHNKSISFGSDPCKDNSDPEQAVRQIKQILDENYRNFNGHVLIFAPGPEHVAKLREFAASHAEISAKFHVLCVYGNNQSRELFRDYKPKFKLIISTRVTQSAITISDLAVVIDSGWESVRKVNRWIGTHEATWMKISRSTSIQRRGRLGRTCDGAFYPLYSEEDLKSMAEFERSSMDKYSCSQQILWILRYKRNAFTMKMVSEIERSKDPQLEAVLKGLFKEMNYTLQKCQDHELALDVSTIKKNLLTLDDNERQFQAAVNKVLKKQNFINEPQIKDAFNLCYRRVCESLLKGYKIFDIIFIDNEWYLRYHFTQIFLQEVDRLKAGLRDIVYGMLRTMNPCLKCCETPIDPIVATENCLNCTNKKLYNNDSLTDFAHRYHLTLNYRHSYLVETIYRLCGKPKQTQLIKLVDKALEELEKFKKSHDTPFSNSMPSATKICLTEDILSLYYYGLVTGITKTNALKNWNTDRFRLDDKVDMLREITLTSMGVFASEIDDSINTAVCLYKSIELGCDAEMAKLLAIQSQDWFLFSTKFEDSSGTSKRTRKDIMKKWAGDTSEGNGEIEVYVKIYDEFSKIITSQDLPEDTRTVADKIKDWAKLSYLDGSCWENVQNNYLYWKDNLTKLKEKFGLERPSTSVPLALRKAMFYGNWQSIGYAKLVKGKTSDDDELIYSVVNLHGRDELRYNLKLTSVLEDIGNENLSDRYFVCFSQFQVQNPRSTQNEIVRSMDIKASCISLVERAWIQELPEPLRTNAICVPSNPKQHQDADYDLFNEDLHEYASIFVKAKRGHSHFHRSPQEIRAQMNKIPFFNERYLAEVKAKEDVLCIRFKDERQYEQAKGRVIMLFGKWCTTGLWTKLRWPRQVKIHNRDWKRHKTGPPQISAENVEKHGIQETKFYPDTCQLIVTFKTEEETRKFVQDKPDIFGENYDIKYNYKADRSDYRYILESDEYTY